MPSIGQNNLREPAVYWELTGYDGNGRPTLADPIQIRSRWEKNRDRSQDPDKGPITETYTVYVDRKIVNDSKLWQGCLENLPPNLVMQTVTQARNYDEIPNLKGRDPQRTVIVS